MQEGALLFSSRKAQLLRNETYLSYVAVTKDEAQRHRWTFCEVVTINIGHWHGEDAIRGTDFARD